MERITTVLLTCLWLLTANVKAAPIILDENNSEKLEGKYLGKQTSWYRGDADINTVLSEDFSGFTLGKKEVLSFGFDSTVYWFKVVFSNTTTESKTIHLYDTSNYVSEYDIYIDKVNVNSLFPYETF